MTAAACIDATSMLCTISSYRSDDGETPIGLCRKRELPRFVTAHQPPPRLQASTIRVRPVSSYKGSASCLPGLSFSLQRHSDEGNTSTRPPASSPSSCGTPSHSVQLPFGRMMDKHYLDSWVKPNMESSNHYPYSEASSSQSFHCSLSLSDHRSRSRSDFLSHPESVNHPPLSYAVTPKIAPEHPYPARQPGIPPSYLHTRHVFGVRRPFPRLTYSHASRVPEYTYGTHTLSSPHEGVCRALPASPQPSLSPRLSPPFMTSVTRPSLHPHERAPVGCSLDPSSTQYHQQFQQPGQLLIHPTTTRQSNARDWTVRQRHLEGATLPPLSVRRTGSSSHIPSSEHDFASHQTHRQTDLPRPHRPSHTQQLSSYVDHSRRLQRHSGDVHHSVLEHHPIVRSQRHPSHPGDHIYSSPVLERVPFWTGVDETEGDRDMDVRLPTDAAAPPSGSTAPRNLPAIISPKERRPHKCPHEDCQMSFPRPSALRTHLNKHTGDKPFHCPILECERPFAVRSNARRHLRVHGLRIKTRVRSRTIALPPSQPEALSDIHRPARRTKHVRISSGSLFSNNQPLKSNAYHVPSTSNQGDAEDPLAAMLEEIEFVTPFPEDEDCHAPSGRYRRRLPKDDAPLAEIPTECPKLVAEYLDKLIKPPSVWSKDNEGTSSGAKRTIISPIPGAWPLYETQDYFPIASDPRLNALDRERSNSITDDMTPNTHPILKYSGPRHLASSIGHTAQLNNVTNSASTHPAESPAYTSRPGPPVSPSRPSLSATTHALPALPSSIHDKERDGTWIPTSLMRFSNSESPSTADENDRSQVNVKPGTPFSAVHPNLASFRTSSPQDPVGTDPSCHPLTWLKRPRLPGPPVYPGSYHARGVSSQREGPIAPSRVHAAA